MAEKDKGSRFRRATLVAASEFLERHTQASFNQMVVRLELEHEIPEDTGMSVQKKCARLARVLAAGGDREVETRQGRKSLAEAVVLEAAALAENGSQWKPQQVFEQALARDGYALHWEEQGGFTQMWQTKGHAKLVGALPPELAAERTDDEVHTLLAARSFKLSAGHLDQAVGAHGRGDWAAANAQLRTFVEGLAMETAMELGIAGAETMTTENRLRGLAKVGFLSSGRKEWVGDGKGFVNGLVKMLHTEGAHVGLSDADHCTFRLHVTLVTARMWLRRLSDWRPAA